MPRPLPPKPGEVKSAVERVFKNVVTVESYRNPYFIVGDFNGDLSQDLAVVVKPAVGKLPAINDELANWILGDPIGLAMPAPKASPHPEFHPGLIRLQRPRVDGRGVLLAVIHGFQSNGWRDSQATQTYVLKGAAGDSIRTEAHEQVIRAYFNEKLPRIWGDVIAQTIDGHPGFLYYNGAKYCWYDPRSYKPPAPGRMVHGRAATR